MQPLLPAQFFVMDDTVRRDVSISCPARIQYSASAAFGIDRSMGGKVETAKSAADSMLDRFRFPVQGDDEAAIWSFASFPNNDLGYSQSAPSVRQTIQSITEAQFPFNGTALFETMYKAIEDVNQFGKNISKAIIFFTDGVNHTSFYSRTLDDVRIRANISSIKIFVVGMNAPQNGAADMQQLCNATGGFFVPDYSNQSLDSIYRALTLEPIQNYFCTLSFTSLFCPDGSEKTLLIRYYPTGTDSTAAVIHYNAPRIESLLRSLPVWISPDSIQMTTNKKDFTVAFGLSLPSSQRFDMLEFFISHPSTVILDSVAPDTYFQNANIKIIPASGGSWIRFSNLQSPIPQGQVRFGLLKIRSTDANGYRIAMNLTASSPGCTTSKQVYPSNQSVHVSIDTVAGGANNPVVLPIRIFNIDVPEGLQQLQLNIDLSGTAFRIDTSNVFQIDNSIGWFCTTKAYKSGTSADTIVLILEGEPLFGNRAIGSLNLFIRQTAARLNPLTIEPQFSSNINSFEYPQPALEVHNGLVFLQDTCRGDLTLSRVPYNQIRQNAPNPFGAAALAGNAQTNISFSIAQDERITLALVDIFGRERIKLFDDYLTSGSHSYLFDSSRYPDLESGIYFVLLRTPDWSGSIKMILFR